MKCPICNVPSTVEDVRQRKNEAKMRRRVCSEGHTFRSYELSEDRMDELLDYERMIRKIQNVLEVEI